MPLSISVIIPAYNSSRTILRAVNSVMQQTLTADEVIIVDDGSTDNTCELVETHFPSVILIKQKNAGAAAARNTGVRSAKGELIAFLDSDDFWHRQKLEYQSFVFAQHSALGICATKCEFFTESNQLDAIHLASVAIDSCKEVLIDFKEMFRFPFLGTPSVMMKRTLFNSLGGFDESLETAEDVDMWIRAAYSSRYRLVTNPLTYVVAQAQSLSTRARTSPHQAHLKVVEKFMKGKSFSLKFRIITLRKTRAHVYCNWGSTLLVNDQPKAAAPKFLQSFLQYPNARAAYLLVKALFKFTMK